MTLGTNGGPYYLASGTHAIAARVDDVNRFAESDENNNLFTTTATLNASLTAEAPVAASEESAPAPPAGGGSGGGCGALGIEFFFLWALRRRLGRG